MELKKTILEATASELTKKAIALLLLLISTLVVALVPQVRDHILPVLPKPLLAILIGISLSLNLVLLFVAVHFRKSLNLSRKLTPRFGILWSQDQVAHCPACSKPLGHYGEYAVGNWKRMGFQCLSCRQVVLMSNDEGRILELLEAKKLLAAKEPEAKINPLRPQPNDLQSEQPKEQTDSLDETSVRLLRILANPNYEHDEPALVQYISLHPERVKHHLDLLEEGDYIYAIRIALGYSSPTTYHLDRKGREYLLKRNLI